MNKATAAASIARPSHETLRRAAAEGGAVRVIGAGLEYTAISARSRSMRGAAG